MLWRGRRESQNVEDRRGVSGGMIAAGGGIGTVVIALLVWFLGGDPSSVTRQVQLPGQGAQSGQTSAADDELAKFVRVVLADTEDVWNEQFRRLGRDYPEPTLVLFSGQVQSACGFASAASGPFYCPGDQKLYIDLAFYRELKEKFSAPGDFAQAYVIAHEVGHHVQRLLGTTDKLQRARGRLGEEEYNQLSVRLELQADFFAGLWAHHAQKMQGVLEPGDIEEALRAANAIGDDTIQKRSKGYVVPESFTHGTAAQRMAWFKKGYVTGDFAQGDTFNLPDPDPRTLTGGPVRSGRGGGSRPDKW